ncbi:MAG: hypothetical protein AAGG75_08225 [Bacteroidota bacterium]
MKKSRLITVFYTLSGKELRELSKWVRSPFINQQESIVHLFDYLTECRQQLQLVPSKAQAFGKVFPDQAYQDVKLRLLMSDLLKIIERYLVHADYFQDPIKVKLRLATLYRQRQLDSQFERTSRDIRRLQERSQLRDANYYYDSYREQLEQFQFVSSTQPTGELQFQQMSKTLDIAFLAFKLRQSCLQLSQQTVYKSGMDSSFPSDLLHYIEQRYLEEPVIRIYYHCYRSLTLPEEEGDFRQFRRLLQEDDSIFTDIELRDLYLLAINFCIRRVNNEEHHYYNEVLQLYKTGLARGYLTEQGQLSRFTYHNIVVAGLRSGEYSWVEQFIHDYKEQLERRYQDSSFSFNLARLEYFRKNYSPALELLQKSNYKDLLLNLAAKTVLLKIYFELEELSLLDSHLEAMNMFIRRKKVIGYHQTNYLNIIQYTKKLMAVNPYDRADRLRLRQQIEAEEILTEREWLLEQL